MSYITEMDMNAAAAAAAETNSLVEKTVTSYLRFNERRFDQPAWSLGNLTIFGAPILQSVGGGPSLNSPHFDLGRQYISNAGRGDKRQTILMWRRRGKN